jgi:hypothetical protein
MVTVISCTKDTVEPKSVTSSNEENLIDAASGFSILYRNSFNNNSQGWKISGDAQDGNTNPTYNSTGGVSGGYISATDDVTGGVWYFNAPAKFLENMKDKYGKTLRFSLKQSATSSQFDADDVIIEGNGLVLHYDTKNNPNTTWTKYNVALKAGQWLKDDNTQPIKREMENALQHITKLWIRGEYITGADEGGLDNVQIAERISE